MRTVFVTCAPGMEQRAEGFALAQPSMDDDGEDIEVKVCVRFDCPPDKIYLTDKPLPEPYKGP